MLPDFHSCKKNNLLFCILLVTVVVKAQQHAAPYDSLKKQASRIVTKYPYGDYLKDCEAIIFLIDFKINKKNYVLDSVILLGNLPHDMKDDMKSRLDSIKVDWKAC